MFGAWLGDRLGLLQCRVGGLGCASSCSLVRAFGVVDPLEFGQLAVELPDRFRSGLGGQPELEGAVEPFDLALGLRVVRPTR